MDKNPIESLSHLKPHAVPKPQRTKVVSPLFCIKKCAKPKGSLSSFYVFNGGPCKLCVCFKLSRTLPTSQFSYFLC